MVGLIHQILMDLLRSQGGDDLVEDVVRIAKGTQPPLYRINASYPDEEWQRLVQATCQRLDVTLEQVEDLFAEAFLQDALRRWPTWFQMSSNSREMLIRQPAIHNSLSAGVADQDARRKIQDKFHVEEHDLGITTHYQSPNQLCGLYKALARRVIDHYGDQARLNETQCMRKGDAECTIHITWDSFGESR